MPESVTDDDASESSFRARLKAEADGLRDLPAFQHLAAEVLDPQVREYVDGGAGGRQAIQRNVRAWDRWAILARALVNVEQIDLSCNVLGCDLDLPMLLAPTGSHGSVHPGGELETAEAARRANTLMVLSMSSSRPLSEVAATGAKLWLQLYWGRDRGALRELLAEAKAVGIRALCLTVDMPRPPWLDRPMVDAAAAMSAGADTYMPRAWFQTGDPRAWLHDSRISWADLSWLRDETALPIVLKGITHPDDARTAIERGVDGIVVSNHGGRALEDALTTAEALPRIVDAVGDATDVLVDGGLRSGGDVLKALALGARAALIGRPVLWALGVAGAAGIERVLTILEGGLTASLAMAGCTSVGHLGSESIMLRQVQ
jgi:4-hydroxymandelate oxidase